MNAATYITIHPLVNAATISIVIVVRFILGVIVYVVFIYKYLIHADRFITIKLLLLLLCEKVFT